MILAFDIKPKAAVDLRAALHPHDSTARPQVVQQEWDPEYHAILEAFRRRTGRGGVLNTSFNLHGFPIVATPQDALDVFERSGLRHLELSNTFLVSKV